MDKKKLGYVLIAIGVVLGVFVWNMAERLEQRATEQDCDPTARCQQIDTVLGYSHMAIGGLGAVLALGLYLIFFPAMNKKSLEQLEREKEQELEEKRTELIMQGLDENEEKIARAVADQPGITQKTLTLRTGLAKSTVSQALSSLESKDIVSREAKGKTYEVYLKQEI